MTLQPGRIKCMMFDLDGTLIDSIPPYFRLLEAIFDTLGLPQPAVSLKKEFIGIGPSVFAKMIPPERAHETDALVRSCMQIGRQLSQNMFRDAVSVFPGVGELFDLLGFHGIPIAIVSTTERQFIERKLQPLAKINLVEKVAAIVAIEDAPRRKPAPDPLLVGARRLSMDPAACVYVGDSCVDIRAGKAAGMQTIAVLSGVDDRDALAQEKPTEMSDGVLDIWQRLSAFFSPSTPMPKESTTHEQKKKNV